jgi:RNA polymerase sigma-70 factor (ECF subfamily)
MEMARVPIRSAIWRGLSTSSAEDRAVVDDLVQETCLKICSDRGAALRRLANPSPTGVIAYLRAMAHNVANDFFRTRMAAKRGGDQIHVTLDDASRDASIGGPTAVERLLLIDQIQRCLKERHKAVRDRAVFWLYFRQGLTAKAIASIGAVGMSQKGVESLLVRILRAIRDCVRGKVNPNASRPME